MTWADERARFPVLAKHAYLNAGSVGPLARETLDAMATLRAWEAENGRAGRSTSRRCWRAATASVRCSPRRLPFPPTASR